MCMSLSTSRFNTFISYYYVIDMHYNDVFICTNLTANFIGVVRAVLDAIAALCEFNALSIAARQLSPGTLVCGRHHLCIL